MHRTAFLTAAALVAVMALGACGDDDESTTAALAAADGVKTGPGVTDSTITLGVLTDQSGVFKDFGRALDAGHKIWVDEINAAGGICERQVQLETRDHGYKADVAKLLFPDMEPKIAAFIDLLGSPVVAALQQDLKDTQATAVVGSFSSVLLENPYLLLPSTSYDIDMINGLSYLLKKKIINSGDTVGHIYLEGELGLERAGRLGVLRQAARHQAEAGQGAAHRHRHDRGGDQSARLQDRRARAEHQPDPDHVGRHGGEGARAQGADDRELPLVRPAAALHPGSRRPRRHCTWSAASRPTPRTNPRPRRSGRRSRRAASTSCRTLPSSSGTRWASSSAACWRTPARPRT